MPADDPVSDPDPRWVEVADTIEARPDATIIPALGPTTPAREAVEDLRKYRAATPSAFPRRYEIGEIIGEGGMGVVRLATQTVLGRQVAVKSPRSEAPSERELHSLLQEAWITGSLEHPNIVPIHDVTVDSDGRPHIVLKRVSGTTWNELMRHPDTVRERFGVADVLEWHLRVLLQICNAVHFAHSQGIIHRDLKPENVMVGEFGEVYVLDWGIALSLEDDPSGRLAPVSEATRMAGTPAYMAPEMLGGSPPRLGPRTDVYLLGAMLYELLTGRAPHTGKTNLAIVLSVVASEPEISADAPEELSRIALRAMRRRPEDRYPDVESLRTAIEGFLRHSGSAALGAKARERLVSLEAATEAGDERQGLYNRFGACQFGFRAALHTWLENGDATLGLTEATEVMARYELERGDPTAARTLVEQIVGGSEDLRAQIDAAAAAKATEDEETEALAEAGRQMDWRIGAGPRRGLAFTLGLVWFVSPLIRLAVEGNDPLRVSEILLYNIALAALAAVFLFLEQRVVFATRYNRLMFGALVVVLGSQIALGGAAWLQGADTVDTELVFATTACICAMIALTMEWRFWIATLGYVASWAILLYRPDARWLLISFSNLVLVASLMSIWRPGAPPPRTSPDSRGEPAVS